MARPRTVSDATLLEATARTIGEVGQPGLTLARVGASCGLSAAAVVQRFGSKRALLLALARRGADHPLPPAGAPAPAPPPASAGGRLPLRHARRGPRRPGRHGGHIRGAGPPPGLPPDRSGRPGVRRARPAAGT